MQSLVIGESREAATRLFGAAVDRVVTTTYAEVGGADGLDPAGYGFVGVAAGPGMLEALATTLEVTGPDTTVAVEVPEDTTLAAAVREVLGRSGVAVTGTRRYAERVCLLVAHTHVPATYDAGWVLDALLDASRRTPDELHAQQARLSTSWELASLRERSAVHERAVEAGRLRIVRLELELDRMTRHRDQLQDRLDEVTPAETPDEDAEPKPRRPKQAPAEPPAPSRGQRLVRAASGLLGAEGSRGRSLTLAVLVVGVLVLLVGVPVVFGLIDGATGALIGVGTGVLVLLGLLLAGGLLSLARSVQGVARQSEERHSGVAHEVKAVREAQREGHEAVLTSVRRTAKKSGKQSARLARSTERRLDAALNLRDMVPTAGGVPALAPWTTPADHLVSVVDELVALRPRLVVQAGSGVGTLFLALAAEQRGIDTTIVALEHHAGHAADTRDLLARHGVAHRVDVRHAPLARTALADHPTPWYDEAAIEDLRDIGLVVVDGPPWETGPARTFPTVPLLADRLAATCTILVGGDEHSTESEVVSQWAALLPDFREEPSALEAGGVALRRTQA